MFFLAVTVVFGKSQENVIDITFNKLGAVYHKNESGNAVCKVIKQITILPMRLWSR